ncbi:Golgi apparatus protein 1-like, partial [Saccoglossus kowalevskii]|uniref:Golgi apparatus protein 1-like n=1 Tax=Saccoglossus kowalevskii TaxID=10224 RepID=A0ABM0MCB2_SACKO
VLSCLMEHLYTSAMVPDCQKQLLELQYFVSRDFRLDPRLYKMCNNDAVTLCHAPDDWANADAGVSEEDDSLGPGVIFACLHRYLHPSPGEQKLSRQCSAEVHRVLRQRADNVRLNPHIEAMCRVALGEFCSENVNSGEEMDCLQQNYEKLDGKCKALIQNFTTEESEDIKLDRLLMRACEPMLNRFCK